MFGLQGSNAKEERKKKKKRLVPGVGKPHTIDPLGLLGGPSLLSAQFSLSSSFLTSSIN